MAAGSKFSHRVCVCVQLCECVYVLTCTLTFNFCIHIKSAEKFALKGKGKETEQKEGAERITQKCVTRTRRIELEIILKECKKKRII